MRQFSNKIYFIIPPTSHRLIPGREFILSAPLEGVCSISLVLGKMGYNVEIVDYRRCQKNLIRDFERSLSDACAICITTTIDSFDFLVNFTRHVKQLQKDIPIVLGGSLVSSSPLVVLKNTEADVAVIGEGESTVKELFPLFGEKVSHKIKEVKGIYYKDSSGKVLKNPPRKHLTNLDNLPVLDFGIWTINNGYKFDKISYSTTRGCPWNCFFCFKPMQGLRCKSRERIEEEISNAKEKYNIKEIVFTDSTFNFSSTHIESICEILQDYDIKWTCMMRAQNVNQSLLRKMKNAGCKSIRYGIETLNQDILTSLKQGIQASDIENTINMTIEQGIKVVGFFMIGLPGATEESLIKMIDFVEKKKQLIPKAFYFIPLPGSRLYGSALRNSLIKDESEYLYLLSQGTDRLIINFSNIPEHKLRKTFRRMEAIMKERLCS